MERSKKLEKAFRKRSFINLLKFWVKESTEHTDIIYFRYHSWNGERVFNKKQIIQILNKLESK